MQLYVPINCGTDDRVHALSSERLDEITTATEQLLRTVAALNIAIDREYMNYFYDGIAEENDSDTASDTGSDVKSRSSSSGSSCKGPRGRPGNPNHANHAKATVPASDSASNASSTPPPRYISVEFIAEMFCRELGITRAA